MKKDFTLGYIKRLECWEKFRKNAYCVRARVCVGARMCALENSIRRQIQICSGSVLGWVTA